MQDILSPNEAARQFLSALRKPSRLLIAVSGGSDSTGLLLGLHQALADFPASDIQLCAATIDHALRPGSADEAMLVKNLCTRLGIPHSIRRWDDEKPPTGLSAAARSARYRLLAEAAADVGADAIVIAHTLEDQAETILMRAARSDDPDGAGLSGMADAVLYGRQTWILRPFLHCRRADIRALLTALNESWIDDPSNIDRRSERVRVRQTMAETGGARVAGEPAQRRRRMAVAAAELLRHHAISYDAAVVRIERTALAGAADILLHALSSMITVLGGRQHPPGRETLDRVAAFLAGNMRGRMTAGRAVLDLRADGLYVMRERRNLPVLSIEPGETDLWDGRFHVRNVTANRIHVGSGGTEPLDPTLPPQVARHAAAVRPRIIAASDAPDTPRTVSDLAQIEVALGPYDRFLSEFDLPLADEIATLLGRTAYPRPPIEVLLT